MVINFCLLSSETDSSDGGTVAEFDFLVNGEFLNETLEKHIETRNISTVRKIPPLFQVMS